MHRVHRQSKFELRRGSALAAGANWPNHRRYVIDLESCVRSSVLRSYYSRSVDRCDWIPPTHAVSAQVDTVIEISGRHCDAVDNGVQASISPSRPPACSPVSIIIPLEFPRRPGRRRRRNIPQRQGRRRGTLARVFALPAAAAAAAAGWFAGGCTGPADGAFIDWCRRRTSVEAAAASAAGWHGHPARWRCAPGRSNWTRLDDRPPVDRPRTALNSPGNRYELSVYITYLFVFFFTAHLDVGAFNVHSCTEPDYVLAINYVGDLLLPLLQLGIAYRTFLKFVYSVMQNKRSVLLLLLYHFFLNQRKRADHGKYCCQFCHHYLC